MGLTQAHSNYSSNLNLPFKINTLNFFSQKFHLSVFLILGYPINRVVKERADELDGKFAKLLAFAHEKLKALVSADTLRVYITQLSVSQKEQIPLFSKHMADIISETSHSKIFTLLSRMGAWSMLNFRLLHRITEEYGDDELKAELSSYSTDVDVFKQETTLEDYLYVMSSRSAYGSLPERQALIVKVMEEWKGCTLADVAEEECYLANEFQLEPHIMHFSNGKPGSVVLMWLIPAAAVSLIVKAMEKGTTLNRKILQLIVDGKEYTFKVCIDNHACIQFPGLHQSFNCLYNTFSMVHQKEKLQSGAWEQGYICRKCVH